MARTYAEFVSLVRNWANRDTAALSDSVIQDCLRYAADKAYRKLRISQLEATVTYDSASLIAATTPGNGLIPSKTEISIPQDLIEFIQIREIDTNGMTTRLFNEKTDLRTFNDYYGEKYNPYAYWARQGSTLLLSPGFKVSGSLGNPDKIEIHYYRRFPALNAKYDVNVANYNAGLLNSSTSSETDSATLWIVATGENAGAYATEADVPEGATAVETYFIGKEVDNWLRDENDRIILMGALAECFFYLQDDEQAAKYGTLFINEIEELNQEDKRRNASGGNVQVNFNGRGLI